jgi:phosphoserine phosphatase
MVKLILELQATYGFVRRIEWRCVKTVAENLPITQGAHRCEGWNITDKTAILSGGFSYFGHYLQGIGIDYVHANELEL